MGKAIVYCQSCGKSLHEDDFERGRAFKQQNHNFCAACRPDLVATAAPRAAERTPPARTPPPERLGSSGRIALAPKPPESRAPILWISVAVGIAVVALAAVVLATRSDVREEPRSVAPSRPPPPKPTHRPGPPPEPPAIDRELPALRRMLDEPLKNWNLPEIEALLKSANDHAGARRADVDKARKDYERGLRIFDLREGLIGRWSLDDSAGAVAHDSSGRGNDGKIVGSPGRVPGRIGGAFQFHGGEDYVEIPTAGTEFDIRNAASYTIAAWFLPDDLPSGKGASDNDRYYGIVIRQGLHVGLSYAWNGVIGMSHWLAGAKQAAHSAIEALPPKAWMHVVGVVDARTGRTSVYLNGKSAGESAWAGKSSAGMMDHPWRIGIGAPKAKEWGWSARGLIDEVLFYARPLTPEDIALLAEGVVPPDADPRKVEPSDAGLAVQLRADRDVKVDGGLAAAWVDPARGIEAASAVREERPAISSVSGQPALRFDGSNDRLAIPARPALSFEESDSFTLAVRVNLATAPNGRWQGIVEKSIESTPWYGIWLDDRGRWVFGSTLNLHGCLAKAGTSLVVAVQDGGKERRLYVDGRRVATGPAMNGTGPGLFWIGGANGKQEFFSGEILEVRLWRRALEPAEIRGLAK